MGAAKAYQQQQSGQCNQRMNEQCCRRRHCGENLGASEETGERRRDQRFGRQPSGQELLGKI